MSAEAAQPILTPFEWDQRRLLRRNHEAVLTMWTGIGAILSLLLTCFLGSLWRSDMRTTISVVVMVLLLIASLILYFSAGKREERWYLVCSLVNHAGIGLAVLILLDALEIDIRLKQLALSGLPAAAILFGVVMIYVGMEARNRKNLLYVGAAVFGLAVLLSVWQFCEQPTEFWLCTAVCALLSCVNLCALIWTSREPEQRSIYRALAAASFGVYIALAVAAIAAFFVAAAGKSDRNSNKKLFSKEKRGKSSGGSGGLLGRSGAAKAVNSGTGFSGRTRTYLPTHIWYYSLYHGRARYGSSRTAAEDLPEEDRLTAERRLRRRRRIVFCLVSAAAILVIALAVIFGRG